LKTAMVIGTLRIHLYFPESRSLKEKRQVLKGYQERIRKKFNVSTCELGLQNSWDESIVAVVYVNSSRTQVERVLEEIVKWNGFSRKLEVIDYEKELL